MSLGHEHHDQWVRLFHLPQRLLVRPMALKLFHARRPNMHFCPCPFRPPLQPLTKSNQMENAPSTHSKRPSRRPRRRRPCRKARPGRRDTSQNGRSRRNQVDGQGLWRVQYDFTFSKNIRRSLTDVFARALDACLTGHDAMCTAGQISGYYTAGTFQQYVCSAANYVTPIPDNVDSAAAAPLLCGGVTVYSALRKCGASPGQWVAIMGMSALAWPDYDHDC